MKVGFIGLGKLGLPVALAVAGKGHEVRGYDPNPAMIDYITGVRKYPHEECGVQELLDAQRGGLQRGSLGVGVTTVDDIAAWADLVLVAVQTPHRQEFEGITPMPAHREEFDYTFLRIAVARLSEAAYRADRVLPVAVISTVLPGTMDREIRPLLGDYLRLCYTPFFIAMGTCIRDFLHPEFVLLGVDDQDAALTMERFFGGVTDGPIIRMSVRSAECTKVCYNTFITAKIEFTNTVGRLCHETGANADDVMGALKMAGRRITSTAYMNVGMPDGGGCHPRDNIALSAVAKRLGWSWNPWDDMMRWRESYCAWLADMMLENGPPPYKILGYSFKEGSNLTTGSPALLVAHMLKEAGIEPEMLDDRTVDFTWKLETGTYLLGCRGEWIRECLWEKGSVVIDPHRMARRQDGVKVIRIGDNNE